MGSKRDERLAAAATSLALDARAAEVVRALEKAGIASVLLKGPAIARWLYAETEAREYSDIDLLVAPQQFLEAERVLGELGFVESTLECAFPQERPRHARTWTRPHDATVLDLHRTLVGAVAVPATVWDVLSARTESLRVGGSDLEVLNPASRAVVVALHAAHQGIQFGQPLRDLERSLELLAPEIWKEAAEIADELEALPAFVQGLRLVTMGEVTLSRLTLSGFTDLPTLPPTGQAFRIAQGFDWLRTVPGIRAKAVFLIRKLVPRAEFIRARSAVARRGRLGLIAAYVWRLLQLLRYTPAAISGWRRARSGARVRRML